MPPTSFSLKLSASGENSPHGLPPLGTGLLVVLDQRKNVEAGKLRAPFQETEFDGEARARDFASEFTHQRNRRRGGAARGEQIVADQHALPRTHSILVDFER